MGRSDNGQTECLQGHAAVVTGNEINQKKLRFILHSVLKFWQFFHTHTAVFHLSFFFFFGWGQGNRSATNTLKCR